MIKEIEFSDFEYWSIFGEYAKLRKIPIVYAGTQKSGSFDQQLLKTEHAFLIGFILFVMNHKERYVLSIPELEATSYDNCNELIEKLREAFLWPKMDAISPVDYDFGLQVLSPGYIRPLVHDRKLSVVDIYLAFSGYSDGITDFSDYEERAKKLAEKEICKMLEIPPHYLEEPEGKEHMIEEIITEKNFYRIGVFPWKMRDIDQPPISDEEAEKKELDDIAEARKRINMLLNLGYRPGFVFVDPRLIEKEGGEINYHRIKLRLERRYGWDVLKSPIDLLKEFVGEEINSTTENQWREIADNLFGDIVEKMVENNRDEFLRYEDEIRNQIFYWDRLDNLSKTHLSLAEFLFDQFKTIKSEDFSAAVLLFCKSLENEIREKLFGRFAMSIVNEHSNFREDFKEDFENEKAKILAERIAKSAGGGTPVFTLGEMATILRLVFKENEKSGLFEQFRQFVVKYFRIDSSFWPGIHAINQQFRVKSAHPNGKLSQNEAEECREKVFKEISKFLSSKIK